MDFGVTVHAVILILFKVADESAGQVHGPYSVSYTHLAGAGGYGPAAERNPQVVKREYEEGIVDEKWIAAVSYTHLDVYKRQGHGTTHHCHGEYDADLQSAF